MGGSAGAKGEKKTTGSSGSLVYGRKSIPIPLDHRTSQGDYTAIALRARLRWDQTPMPS